MKQQELFEKTIQTLASAYLNGTLIAGNCKACAVGNIVGHSGWNNYFTTAPIHGADGKLRITQKVHFTEEQGEQIYENMYPLKVFAHIEKTFEEAFVGSEHNPDSESPMRKYSVGDIDKAHFDALMAVVDLLCEYHEVEEDQPYREMFVR